MHNPLPALILLAFWFGRIDSASILAVVPVNSRSHFIVMEPLFRALASRGHQITVVGLYPQKTPLPNYTDIDVSDLFPSKSLSFAIDYIKANIYSTTNCVKAVASIGYDTCRVVYKDERISQLYNSSAKFDLVITEIFSSDCFVMFAEKFDAPIISFVTSVALPWSNDRIGNPDNPSYIVNYFHAFAHQMSLYERVVNTASLIYSKALYYYEADFTHARLLGEIFGGDRVPDLYEIYNRRTAMVFVNSHYTVNQPRPMVPNFIEIGGIHVQQSAPLPKDLQELLDKADKGFILFSMGTLVNMSTFSDHVLTSFLKTFSSFEDLLVLWKHDGQLPNQPKNVITRKFFPQKDILVHKNLKMFITHGGLSSTLEVVNAGVPIMGIPMFGDQPGNVMNLVRRRAGISIDYDSITTELLTTAINKILQDNSYKENALKLSRLFNDRPQSALDSAVFWTEHVLKHRGAPHMRSAAADMPLYKVLLLDAAAIFLLATFIVCAAIHKIVHFFRPAQKQRQTTGKTSKKRD